MVATASTEHSYWLALAFVARKQRKRLRFLRFSQAIAFEWKPGFTSYRVQQRWSSICRHTFSLCFTLYTSIGVIYGGTKDTGTPAFWTGTTVPLLFGTQVKNLLSSEAICGDQITLIAFSTGALPWTPPAYVSSRCLRAPRSPTPELLLPLFRPTLRLCPNKRCVIHFVQYFITRCNQPNRI